ncbi:hypothetical protein SAMN04515647_4635 [Cohaesibacter sp. ES.047]|nr:hypothetical protein SAMN04515647_4635 [Cohaesibacter sp. ES.047]
MTRPFLRYGGPCAVAAALFAASYPLILFNILVVLLPQRNSVAEPFRFDRLCKAFGFR